MPDSTTHFTTHQLEIQTREEGPFWAAEAYTEEPVGATLTAYEGSEHEAVAKVMAASARIGVKAVGGFNVTRHPKTEAPPTP